MLHDIKLYAPIYELFSPEKIAMILSEDKGVIAIEIAYAIESTAETESRQRFWRQVKEHVQNKRNRNSNVIAFHSSRS